MARTKTRNHNQGDQSRRTILDATLRIASERGYVGTTMAQLTKASGLPASSVYWHFHNKDELLADALDHGFHLWTTVAPRWEEDPGQGPLADLLLERLRASTRGLEEEPGFWRMGLMLALETGPAVGSEPRNRFLKIRAGAMKVLEQWWSRALDATGRSVEPEPVHLLVQLTIAALDGIFTAHQSEQAEDLDAVLVMLAAGLASVAEDLADGTWAPDSAAQAPTLARNRVVASEADSGRHKLLRAAAEVAAESGYEGATISRICKRAGLPASSLYWHFKDKDDLLAAVVEHAYQEWYVNQPLWLPPEPGTSWQVQLRDHLAVTLASLEARPLFLRIGHLLLLLKRSDSPAGRTRFIGVRRRVRMVTAQWFRDALGDDVDPLLPGRLSLVLMVMWDGLFFSHELDTPAWDAPEFAALLARLLGAAAGEHWNA